MAAAFPIDFTDHHDTDSADLSARQREALEAMLPEIEAVDPKTFLTINIDIPAAVITVSGRLRRLIAYREAVVRELPLFDVTSLDKLEATTLALGQAHTNFHAASQPAEPVQPLVETLIVVRDFLLSDASVLAKRQIIDGERLNELQGTNGFKNLAFDVLLLCAIFRDNWDVIDGRTAVKPSELDHSEGVANRLTAALGSKEAGSDAAPAATVTRQAAFTLFMARYGAVRRAVTYLRWDEDDIDTIAPSLYAGRNRKKSDASEQEPAVPPTGTSPAGQPASPSTPATPTPSTTSNGSALPAAASLIGLPGDTPFNH